MLHTKTDELIPLTEAAGMVSERYRSLYDKALGGMLGPLTREGVRIYVTIEGVEQYMARQSKPAKARRV